MTTDQAHDPSGGTAARSTAVIDTARLTYTVDEVARLLSLSRGVTYQHIRDGHIPADLHRALERRGCELHAATLLARARSGTRSGHIHDRRGASRASPVVRRGW